MMAKARDGWIDLIKIYACILVVLGHFVQSMLSSSVIEPSALSGWFLKTIYYFHVPLFFIASGYVYQKYSKVENFAQYRRNITKKLIALGIPYFSFSIVTWAMKMVFSSSVNSRAEGLLQSLFVSPISPYWFLYALFFIFALIPTFSTGAIAAAITTAALAAKCLTFMGVESGVYAVDTVMQNALWFVLGMLIYTFRIDVKLRGRIGRILSATLLVLFISASVLMYIYGVTSTVIVFMMGLGLCAAFISAAVTLTEKSDCAFVSRMSIRYTMPIFLMHTIFAAGLRALMLKAGIHSAPLHIVAGVTVSFAGPMIFSMITSRVAWLDLFIDPVKYIKLKKAENPTGDK